MAKKTDIKFSDNDNHRDDDDAVHTGSDEVKVSKGTHKFMRGFYYKNGTSSDEYADSVSNHLKNAGIMHTVLAHGTKDYVPFKGGAPTSKQNHHWVQIKVHGRAQNEDLLVIDSDDLVESGSYKIDPSDLRGTRSAKVALKKRVRSYQDRATAKRKVKIGEETVELDEISMDLKKRYVDKAIKSGTAAGYGAKSQVGHAFKRMQRISKTERDIEDNTPLSHKPKVHDVRHMSDGEVYDHTQTSKHVKDGDVLHMSGGRKAIMFKAWPTMHTGESKALHSLKKPGAWPARYHSSSELAHSVKEEAEIDESLRLIGTHHSESGKHHAKVYKDTDWDEYRVKLFRNGKHHEPADSFHSDKQDAHDTAKAMLAHEDKHTKEEAEVATEGKTFKANSDYKVKASTGKFKKAFKAFRDSRDSKRKSIDKE